jgi:cytoskeleton protein RodZ
MTMNDQENTNTVVLGKVLQNARLSASLTVEEVALQLNLAISTVRDIEDELDKVIKEKKYPYVYLRGYIVNYAKLVALDSLEQFPEYQQLSIAQEVPKNILPSVKVSPGKKRGKLLFLLILSAVIGLVFFAAQQFLFSRTNLDAADSEKVQLEEVNIPIDAEQGLVVKKKTTVTDESGE